MKITDLNTQDENYKDTLSPIDLRQQEEPTSQPTAPQHSKKSEPQNVDKYTPEEKNEDFEKSVYHPIVSAETSPIAMEEIDINNSSYLQRKFDALNAFQAANKKWGQDLEETKIMAETKLDKNDELRDLKYNEWLNDIKFNKTDI